MNKERNEIIDKFFNSKRHTINSCGDSKIIMITSKELKEISSVIKHPIIQTTKNDDKVKEMCDLYNEDSKYKHHFLSCCLISIARQVVGNNQDYYLVDGQHRIDMALDLFDKNEDSKTFLIAIITVKTKEEMKSLMLSINKDSKKYIYHDYPIFDQKLFEELKEIYQERYSLFLPKKVSSKTKIYGINEFIDILIKNKLNKNIINTIEFDIYLVKKEKEFFSKFCYLEKLYESKEKFKKSEILCIENKSCMFIQSNNFIEWLIDPSIIPFHDFKQRLPISKKLQEQIWQKKYNACTSACCPIYNCGKILSRDISNSWQCGHITSHNNGGLTTLENLKPLCTPCNQKMSDMNWDTYEDKLMRNDIIDDYFDGITDIICKSKNKCKNVITILTFYPWYYKTEKGTNKLKPICFECNKKIKDIFDN